MNSEPIKIDQSVRRLKEFVCERALPLWASAGFDEDAGCFEERLDFSGAPIKNSSRRLMVQARQIVVYARASLQNWHIDKPGILTNSNAPIAPSNRSVERIDLEMKTRVGPSHYFLMGDWTRRVICTLTPSFFICLPVYIN
jgi:hypothetical protein